MACLGAWGDTFDQMIGDGAVAWAYWRRWAGPSELLPHVARRAAQAIADHDHGEPRCSIIVRVRLRSGGHDFERFSSPADFSTNVTRDALSRFDAVRIAVEHAQLEVEVVLARAPGFGPEWLERGALLVVRSAGDDTQSERVAGVRATVAATLDRGMPRFRGSPSSGDGEPPVPPELIRRRAAVWLEEKKARTSDLLDAMIRNGPARRRKRRAYRFGSTPPPDVAAFLESHPDLVKHPQLIRPWAYFVESTAPWLVAVAASVGGIVSIWGSYVLQAAVVALVIGTVVSTRLSRLLLYRVELTDVSRVRQAVYTRSRLAARARIGRDHVPLRQVRGLIAQRG